MNRVDQNTGPAAGGAHQSEPLEQSTEPAENAQRAADLGQRETAIRNHTCLFAPDTLCRTPPRARKRPVPTRHSRRPHRSFARRAPSNRVWRVDLRSAQRFSAAKFFADFNPHTGRSWLGWQQLLFLLELAKHLSRFTTHCSIGTGQPLFEGVEWRPSRRQSPPAPSPGPDAHAWIRARSEPLRDSVAAPPALVPWPSAGLPEARGHPRIRDRRARTPPTRAALRRNGGCARAATHSCIA